MDGTQAVIHEPASESRSSAIIGGSALEGFGAIATIALAIVGLVGVFPPTMAAIAAIVVGAATLVEGGALGLNTGGMSDAGGVARRLPRETGADFPGGLATLVLGILALLGVASHPLLSVAVIALGATFMFSGRALIGLGAVVLGILAVVGFTSLTLVLVGLLILGAGLLLSGSRNAVRTLEARS